MSRAPRALSPGIPTAPYASPAWRDGDVSRVAFRCHAHGADEGTTLALLDLLDRSGARRLGAYVDGMSDGDLEHMLTAARALAVLPATARGRRDILQIRTPARWPWRTSTTEATP